MIKLVEDTIDSGDIDVLIDWLKTNPRLTKGNMTLQFEDAWSKFLGVKHSIYVNSGSSANLGIISAIKQSKLLKNNKVIVPAVAWSTTITPVIQCGLDPILCDCNLNNLGVDLEHLENLFKEHRPAILIIVHVLGFPCDMKEICLLCERYDVILIEDSCESVGSTYADKLTGTFGLCSSFSFYFGHHMSTIEGGMICTNDDELSTTIKSIRSHGWDRDLPNEKQIELRNKYDVDEFQALYTFYWEGYNLRATDLQAKIGLSQITRLNDIIQKRKDNFVQYQSSIRNDYWKPNVEEQNISNFAYPIITPKRKELSCILAQNDIECRPLVCGSIGKQPFWKMKYGETHLKNADIINDYGLYVPNHHLLSKMDIDKTVTIINEVINA